jgi:hypothetical protein
MDQQSTHMRDALVETRKTADAATLSAETAKRALEATQRALVVMTEITTGVVIGDNRELVGFTFFMVFKNSGPTMALDAECTASLICGFKSMADLSHEEPAAATASGSMSIGPGVVISTDPKGGVAIDEIERIRRNEATAFIHGHVEYRDVFENTPKRTTSVCARITLRDDPTIRTADGFNTKAFTFLAGPPEHNRST